MFLSGNIKTTQWYLSLAVIIAIVLLLCGGNLKNCIVFPIILFNMEALSLVKSRHEALLASGEDCLKGNGVF